jgi:hypothetical protein
MQMCSINEGESLPMWMSKSFFGEFGDAFVQDTSLEGGHIAPCITEVAEVMRSGLEDFRGALTLFTDADLGTALIHAHYLSLLS